jgi:uncharacterized membrane protein YphA (DoxX/SURF4 family)
MDPVLIIILRYALALLWVVSAAQKLMHFEEFRIALNDYRLLPTGSTAHAAAVGLIVLELATGITLLSPTYFGIGAMLGAALLLVYAAAMTLNLVRGRRHIDCGCAGPTLRQSLSYGLVFRNLVLAGGSLACLSGVATRSLLWLDYVTIPAAILVLAAFYGTFNRLVANGPDLARLRV